MDDGVDRRNKENNALLMEWVDEVEVVLTVPKEMKSARHFVRIGP
jgi:hypothetical protein